MSESRCQIFVRPLADLEANFSPLDLPPALVNKLSSVIDLALKVAESPVRGIGKKLLSGVTDRVDQAQSSLGLGLGALKNRIGSKVDQAAGAVGAAASNSPIKLPAPIETLLVTFVHNKIAQASSAFVGAANKINSAVGEVSGFVPLGSDQGLLVILDLTSPTPNVGGRLGGLLSKLRG